MRARTFRLGAIGNEFLSRTDIVKGLQNDLDIEEIDIEIVCQLDKGREWFVILKKQHDITKCLERSYIQISEEVSMNFQNITKCMSEYMRTGCHTSLAMRS